MWNERQNERRAVRIVNEREKRRREQWENNINFPSKNEHTMREKMQRQTCFCMECFSSLLCTPKIQQIFSKFWATQQPATYQQI